MLRLRAVAAAILPLFGCTTDDLPEIRYETENLRIGTDFDDDVCAGSIARLEAHTVYVAEQLGVDVDEAIELYWFEDGDAAQCPTGATGCFDADDRRVFTSWEAAPHEIGHAVAWEVSGDVSADEFFAEGAAEAFTGRRTEFGVQSPSLAIGAEDSEDVDRLAAAHFIRWLHQREGAGDLRDLLDRSSKKCGRGHAERAFEKAYGSTLAELEDEYWATAPELIPGDLFCDFPTIGSMSAGFEAHVSLDCAEEHTRGIRWMERSHTFEVETPGLYVIELMEPARALVWHCYTEAVELGEERPEVVLPVRGGDLGEQQLRPLDDWWLEPGTHELYLDAGLYRIDLRIESQGTGEAAVRGHPLIGPSGGRP